MINWHLLQQEENKIAAFNTILNDLYKKNEVSENSEENNERENGDNLFIICVVLLELIPRENATLLKIPKDCNISSPQELLLNKITNSNNNNNNENYNYVCNKILENNNNNNKFADPSVIIGNLVTLYGLKNIWVNEDDLVKNRILNLFAQLTLNDMKEMLKCCPYPDICLDIKNIEEDFDQHKFIRVINSCLSDFSLFDFTPFIRYKRYYLQPHCVYRLLKKIELVDEQCFSADTKKQQNKNNITHKTTHTSSSNLNKIDNKNNNNNSNHNNNLKITNFYDANKLHKLYSISLDSEDLNSIVNNEMISTIIINLYILHILLNNGIKDVVLWPHEVFISEENLQPTIYKLIEDNCKFILLPVCLSKHFILVVFSLVEKIVYILDPLNNISCSTTNAIIEFVTKLVNKEFIYYYDKWRYIVLPTDNHNIPIQNIYSLDCGIYMIIYAMQIIRKKNLLFDKIVYSKEDIDKERRNLYEVLKNIKEKNMK